MAEDSDPPEGGSGASGKDGGAGKDAGGGAKAAAKKTAAKAADAAKKKAADLAKKAVDAAKHAAKNPSETAKAAASAAKTAADAAKHSVENPGETAKAAASAAESAAKEAASKAAAAAKEEGKKLAEKAKEKAKELAKKAEAKAKQEAKKLAEKAKEKAKEEAKKAEAKAKQEAKKLAEKAKQKAEAEAQKAKQEAEQKAKQEAHKAESWAKSKIGGLFGHGDKSEEVDYRTVWEGPDHKDSSGFVKLYSPVGGSPMESLHLERMTGYERISEPFKIDLFMTREKGTVSFDEVMGKLMTVEIEEGPAKRYINGFVGEFQEISKPTDSDEVPTTYMATLYPSFWFLKFTCDCRIFQNKSPVTIIKEVLGEHKVLMSVKTTSAGKKKREFCVQYNESDFDFVSRLMEEEGIYYFFAHKKGKHTMVLMDRPGEAPHVDGKKIPVLATAPMALGVEQCRVMQQTVPIKSEWRSFNYESPKKPVQASYSGPYDGGGGRVYKYPAYYDTKSTVEHWSKTSMHALSSMQHVLEGVATTPVMVPGHKFSLTGHTAEKNKKDYVVYEVVHDLKAKFEQGGPEFSLSEAAEKGEADQLYSCEFRAFPKSVKFAPPQVTPKPKIHSTQTATVTGPKHHQVHTDKYGRVKILFHWDLLQEANEKSSLWVRVAMPWAGSGWGFITTPRIGMEVVVSFLEGDPDKPLIVGCVYNEKNRPPYRASQYTKSTWKTQSVKSRDFIGHPKGFNEFTLEDKDDKEQIYMHAQKDMKYLIQNDWDVTNVGGNFTHSLTAKAEKHEGFKGDEPDKKANHTTTMKHGKHSLTIDKGDREAELKKGNDTLTLKDGNRTTKLSKGNDELTLSDGKQTTTLTKGDMTIKLDKGDLSITVSGNITLKCTKNFTVDAGSKVSIKAGGDYNLEVGGDSSESIGGALETSVGGDLTENVGGALECEVGGDGTLNIGGALECEVGGDGTVNIGGAFEGDVGGAITLTAGGDISATAGGAGTITTGGAGTLTIGGAATMTAGGACTVTSGGACTVTAGGACTVTAAAACTITAAATCAITGATMELTGATVTIT